MDSLTGSAAAPAPSTQPPIIELPPHEREAAFEQLREHKEQVAATIGGVLSESAATSGPISANRGEIDATLAEQSPVDKAASARLGLASKLGRSPAVAAAVTAALLAAGPALAEGGSSGSEAAADPAANSYLAAAEAAQQAAMQDEELRQAMEAAGATGAGAANDVFHHFAKAAGEIILKFKWPLLLGSTALNAWQSYKSAKIREPNRDARDDMAIKTALGVAKGGLAGFVTYKLMTAAAITAPYSLPAAYLAYAGTNLYLARSEANQARNSSFTLDEKVTCTDRRGMNTAQNEKLGNLLRDNNSPESRKIDQIIKKIEQAEGSRSQNVSGKPVLHFMRHLSNISDRYAQQAFRQLEEALNSASDTRAIDQKIANAERELHDLKNPRRRVQMLRSRSADGKLPQERAKESEIRVAEAKKQGLIQGKKPTLAELRQEEDRTKQAAKKAEVAPIDTNKLEERQQQLRSITSQIQGRSPDYDPEAALAAEEARLRAGLAAHKKVTDLKQEFDAGDTSKRLALHRARKNLPPENPDTLRKKLAALVAQKEDLSDPRFMTTKQLVGQQKILEQQVGDLQNPAVDQDQLRTAQQLHQAARQALQQREQEIETAQLQIEALQDQLAVILDPPEDIEKVYQMEQKLFELRFEREGILEKASLPADTVNQILEPLRYIPALRSPIETLTEHYVTETRGDGGQSMQDILKKALPGYGSPEIKVTLLSEEGPPEETGAIENFRYNFRRYIKGVKLPMPEGDPAAKRLAYINHLVRNITNVRPEYTKERALNMILNSLEDINAGKVSTNIDQINEEIHSEYSKDQQKTTLIQKIGSGVSMFARGLIPNVFKGG